MQLGIRQVHSTLLGARRVPERICGGHVYLGHYIKCSTFTFTFLLHGEGEPGEIGSYLDDFHQFFDTAG